MKRVICGRNAEGRNIFLHEDTPRPLGVDAAKSPASPKPARTAIYVAWAAREAKPSIEDYAAELSDFNLALSPGETRFVRVEIAPGAESPMHRTPQVTDYLVAISGELTMIVEDGTSTKLQPGDMLVQLQGWHRWKNEGTVPFVMAGVVVGVATDDLVPWGVERASEGV